MLFWTLLLDSLKYFLWWELYGNFKIVEITGILFLVLLGSEIIGQPVSRIPRSCIGQCSKNRRKRNWGLEPGRYSYWAKKRPMVCQTLSLLCPPHLPVKKLSSLLVNHQTRTDSVQKVCGGVWQGFDHLITLESYKVEVVLQGGLRSSSTL